MPRSWGVCGMVGVVRSAMRLEGRDVAVRGQEPRGPTKDFGFYSGSDEEPPRSSSSRGMWTVDGLTANKLRLCVVLLLP